MDKIKQLTWTPELKHNLYFIQKIYTQFNAAFKKTHDKFST